AHVERGNPLGIEEFVVRDVERRDQGVDFAAQDRIAAAAGREKCVAIGGVYVGERQEDRVGGGQRHDARSGGGATGPSARCSQARANFHSFLTVAGDRSIAAAVSSTLSPAKDRSA